MSMTLAELQRMKDIEAQLKRTRELIERLEGQIAGLVAIKPKPKPKQHTLKPVQQKKAPF